MNVLELFKSITTFVFDVDGVLTDGSLLVMPDGLMVRKMNIKDGYALQLAVKKGYRIVIISGAYSPEVQDRLTKLGVQHIFMRVEDKLACLQQFTEQYALQKEQVLFMGDDIPDIEAMQFAGLACCPADAVPEVKAVVQFISSLNGGLGCARDVIEKVLKLNGNWTNDQHIKAQ